MDVDEALSGPSLTRHRALRRLTPADAADYRALMLEAYAIAPDAFTSSVAEREALPLQWWKSRVAEGADARELVCGAFLADDLAGVAGLRFEQRERTRHKSTLFGMFVRPRCRGAGVGRALVTEILRHAERSPATEVVQLTVTESNVPAVRLYESCGFETFGIEPFAVKLGDRFITKLHMWHRIGTDDVTR